MSDTPETDEQTFAFAVAQKNDPPPDYKLVRAGFAQKLERERDEARAYAEADRDACLASYKLPWEEGYEKPD